ncbi:short-chain fatty acids transporter [Psychroflexus salarius]|uniref:Short-chain fatty acids transporter n=1 Tax=Psychroflexus salarius TaxID=1155689 RepID=A0A1M4WIY9_9FLAO|nr:TIGR00366 family protein [Psychroflexus salarius]SHE81110.1 short-chain fatty acids transporter [Psychroflexus salarius]
MNLQYTLNRFLRQFLPSPLAIAVILTFLSFVLAFLFTPSPNKGLHLTQLLQFWHNGMFDSSLIEFAYQMMLILVLGHVLVLSEPMQKVFKHLLKLVKHQNSAIIVTSVFTMLAGFVNWGLGLVFGAILARKIGEHAYSNNIKINYPLICALGYSGMLIWHGGVSGSATIKVAENGHLASLVPEFSKILPELISTAETTFSWQNLTLFILLLLLIPIIFITTSSKSTKTFPEYTSVLSQKFTSDSSIADSHYLDQSYWLSKGIALLIIIAVFANYSEQILQFQLTPNFLNFSMLGLGLLLHKNLNAYSKALQQAILGAAGILIQFPLYFGIMGVMRDSGLIASLSATIAQFASAEILPVFTFISAAIVNVFVPSGGGQWAIQGPIIINSAQALNVDLRTLIMSLAYGDQVTNMLQPFWALPLLAITKVKAQHLLSYTLIMMFVASLIFISGLLILY